MRTALIATALALMMMTGSPALATTGCCSWHGGVKSCTSDGRQLCNDGTLSPTCTCTAVLHQAASAKSSVAAKVLIKKAVAIKGMQFSPKTLSVKVGTVVTWTNGDAMPHTVTSTGNGPASGTLSKGQSYSYTFAKVGTFAYHCSIHPSMTAKVIVTK